MTSTASPPNTQAPNSSAATSAPSYASAVGASKKPVSTPVVATGAATSTPVVVGGPSAQHAKSSGPSPVNGRPPITPAVPAAPGSNNMNGAGNHSRKTSVTISANGPNSFVGNGGPVGGAPKSNIQFGFKDSPAISHSTPQMTSAPVPIPGSNQQRIPSPSHSPSPIPQPSASGGRPPSGMAPQNAQMTFGSLGSDGDRHMRQGSIPQNPAALGSQSHIRRESAVSQHSDVGGGPGSGANRPNFNPQGGRGRGGHPFNPQHPPFNPNAGFPPNYNNGPPGRGRGGMPPSFHPSRPMGYPNSPQPTRSPALAHSQPGTPNMPPAQMHAIAGAPPYHYPAPGMPPHQFAYPATGGQYDPMHRQAPYYMPQTYMSQGPGGSPAMAYQQAFVPPPYHTPAPASMSRTSSHSERPPSSTGQPNHPVIVSSTQTPNAQPKAPVASSSAASNTKKKSAAVLIKNPQGEIVDVSAMKARASPSPNIQQSKTPPVVASTPPPQRSTASVPGNQPPPKKPEDIQAELREKIKLATSGENKAKGNEAAKAQAPEEPTEKKSVDTKPLPEAEAEAVEPTQKPDIEQSKKDSPVETKATEAKVDGSVAVDANTDDVKPGDTNSDVKTDESKEAAEKTGEPAAKPIDEEDEIERMIREMEEEDARREKETAEYETKRKADLEEKKKLSPEEEDRKLKDAEREAERLEEEKERKRAAQQASGEQASVAELLAKRTATGSATAKEDSSSKVADVAEKLSSLSLGGEGKLAKPAAAEKRVTKPPALNLAPITTKPVEPPQPSAALQSLKSARFLSVMEQNIYPPGISSPNPAVNAAVAKKGKTFKYDAQFLLQFQKVFTEQPSVEFLQQVKSLIGDTDGSRSATPRPGSSRQPSRVGSFAPSQPQNMGSFNARGTTSAERFARSNTGSMGGAMPPPMGTFGRTGSFPVGAPMSRNPSTSNAGQPHSPRTGSRRGNNSRRNDLGAKESQAAKTMPLTQGIDVKPIAISSTGWKPTSIGNRGPPAAAASGHMDPEMVQRKVKAALNKMTPEKFEKIADQIFEIASQSKNESDGRTLRQVIQLTFEKATDEAHWASMYAKFCKRMLDTMSPDIRDENLKDKAGEVICGGALFRKYLLNRCQEEFERGWKMNLPQKPEEDEKNTSVEAAMLSDEYYIAAAAKRRGLGLVQFIGELYKLGMLTERIMHACVQKLVDYDGTPEDAEIESLCKLLRTIGANLDASPKAKSAMDAYFDRIQNMMNLPDLASRHKFMLMDIIDLRKKNWQTKEANKGPKTLEEVRAEAEAQAALKAQESARGNQRGPGGRPHMGRGDSRGFGGYNQQTSNQVGMDDLRRLKGSTSRAASGNISLGPTSMFSSRSNSGRRLGPGGSLGRAGEDSNASSRTGTPPTTHTNAFSALANLDTEHPASPPSTAASPALSKAVPDSSGAGESK
ncbi:hypothetical protein SODALDRAFT_319397 [Sodiomyces alkalinus F11]|uniref:MIF4G domain-containing protein n=1 Tax=Sodiomyces alkalinus (strain CBS 110278 / VKM F-3762 / F11) TaxID=1314773 RepID=A0A3N2Q7Q6_SODAK|nr:hypothetical protein SODALDRAFT_319397 [Sodiomyces alkalinus F11]ROT42794.1 hypothetical protein SODALDRAFT_319397 [Sodiomyces alkalinus F11]